MNLRTLRARIALWTVAVVSGALSLFGASAAWNLRRGLLANLDEGIRNDARDFADELREQRPDWNDRRQVEVFLADEAGRFQVVEVRRGAGRVLFRSPSLGDEEVLRPDAAGRNYTVTAPDGRRVRLGVFENGDLAFALGRDLHVVDETLAGLFTAYLVTLPLAAVAVGAGAWWIARRAAAPVRLMAERAGKISASDLHQRLPEPESEDEIAHLTGVLNAMFERLERSFEQVTRFTSDASHELKTPLALMRAQLENALETDVFQMEHQTSAPPPAQAELLADLIEQCSQLTQIIDGLLFLSRADDRPLAIEPDPVDLVPLLQELREDAEILAASAGLALDFELPAQLVVQGDERLLRRAVMNLIDNAIKYNRAGGRVVVAASREGHSGLLSFRNTGAGISLAAREKLFERFFRSDPARNKATGGHGLGLSITREIARAHRGEVSLVRSDSDWTEFWLLLPMATLENDPPPGEYSVRGVHSPGP